MTKKQLEELHEQGLVLCTEQVVAEDGTISYVTEAVSQLKKDARSHILSCMNRYLKQEKGIKAGFSYNTAMPVFNQFCTQENSQMIVLTYSPSVAKLVGGLAIAGGMGYVIGATAGAAAPALAATAGTATGAAMSLTSGKAFMEFTKAHKKDLQDAVNKDWEHRIEVQKVIKGDGMLPDRVVIKFYKNGGKKSAKNESTTFDFS